MSGKMLYRNAHSCSGKRNSHLLGHSLSMGSYYATKNAPSSGQRALIEKLYREINDAGLTTPKVESVYSIYRRENTASSASALIGLLMAIRTSNHLPRLLQPEYVQLVRNKETGEKKKFRAKHRLGVPKGYELIGTLEINYVWSDEDGKGGYEDARN